MAELKTQANDADVDEFLASIKNETRRQDSQKLCALMAAATGQPPRMWGASIVGFGSYDYTYTSGRSGVWMAIGFAPRAAATTVYLMDGFEKYAEELATLGPHSIGKSCLYIKRLDDVDLGVLEDVIRRSYAAVIAS